MILVKPNGEQCPIVDVLMDEKTNSVKIVLDSGHGRWFKFSEFVVVDGHFIVMRSPPDHNHPAA